MSVQAELFEREGSSRRSTATARVETILGKGVDLRAFVEHFSALVDAAGSTKQLKELVIELAVRGSLVEQRSDEEDALVGLRKIEAERSAAKEKGARVPEPGSVDEPETAYAAPRGWCWVRWGRLLLGSDSGWSPQCENRPRDGDEWGVLKVSAVSWDVFEPNENKALPKAATARPECIVRAGDFLMSRANTSSLVGRSVVVDDEPPRLIMSDKIVRCTFSSFVNKKYVNLFNRSASARAHYMAHASGTSDSMKNISREVIYTMPVPFPPLAEQSRIVAKVDELMALCNELDVGQAKKRETGARLTKSALEALTTADGPEAFDAAWRRVIENFDVLIERTEQVADVRRALVDLAISGRLLPSRALTSAVNLAEKLEATSGYPRDVAKVAMKLPASWAWSRLGAVSSDVRYGYTASAEKQRAGVRLLRITDIQNDRVDWSSVPGCEIDEEKVAAFELHEGDLVIARTGGTIGKTYLVEGLTVRSVFASYLIRVAPLAPMEPRFLKVFSASGLYWRQLYAGAAGTGQPNVNATTLKSLLVPVPPVEEQRLIVAKVEQLMKVCDELEAHLRRAENRAAKLVEAAVQELVV